MAENCLADIRDFLAQKRIAVVGASRNPKDFNAALFREFATRGYDVVPVNPNAKEIDGRPCFESVHDVKPPVDAALILTPPNTTDTVVKDCADAGVKRVWMFRATGKGAVSQAAVEFCRREGIRVVPGQCPFMFLPGSSFPHRVHGFVRKITGRYPA